MGYWEKKIWKRVGKKVVALRQADMNGDGIWSGDLGVEGDGRTGKKGRKIFEVVIGSRRENLKVSDERGSCKRRSYV